MNLFAVRRRIVAVAVAALTPLAVAASTAPAEAGSMFFYKTSGTTASADWLEVGVLPGVPGNIHFGFMQVENLGSGEANVFGVVEDLTCPDGVIPDGPGGGHGEPGEDGCVNEGVRFIEGGDVTFTMDRKFTTARLTGTLVVYGHEGPTGNPPVNMTWTGFGDLYRSVESGRYNDGTSSGSYRYTFSGRDAQVTGNIGAMIFDNTTGEWSNAGLGTYKSIQRDRTR